MPEKIRSTPDAAASFTPTIWMHEAYLPAHLLPGVGKFKWKPIVNFNYWQTKDEFL